jgi:hypothetical protein
MIMLPAINMEERLIHGVVLQCNDGRWFTQDNPDMSGRRLLALSTGTALQRWCGQESIDTIVGNGKGGGLPDVNELNAAIPRDQWELGLDGQPRPPWQRQYIVYLLDMTDASLFTYINSTVGARIAVTRLIECVGWMRALKGAEVFPVITTDSRPMKTAFGTKMRAEFTIVEWHDFGGEEKPAIEDKSA